MIAQFTEILNRSQIKNDIITKINHFEQNKHMKSVKRGFYISGDNGTGKTEFVRSLLHELDYDILHYSACDMRNKSVIENLTKQNMSDVNVMSMFHKKKRKIAIIMDEIDGLNSGDKGGVSTLITLVRQKKTKKQMNEPITNNLVFCISTNEIDKKTKELMKVCNHYEFQKPTNEQMLKLIHNIFNFSADDQLLNNSIREYTQNDLKKLYVLHSLYKKNEKVFYSIIEEEVFMKKSVIEISKDIVRYTFQNDIKIKDHNIYINENDRTIVALLWHENIIDVMKSKDNMKNISFYFHFLQNMCYGDFIDRITFQKQIWQFNELSSFIKIMYNNFLLHQHFKSEETKVSNDVRFTKVLTKYSTEFNNYSFFQNLANFMLIDKKDLLFCFHQAKKDSEFEKKMILDYDIKDLDVSRVYRYMNNYYGLDY